MMVNKKMGGIATGQQRRENRNKMMKTHQVNQAIDSKSMVGSMGSMGSLAPFMGVDPQIGSADMVDFHQQKIEQTN